MKIKEALMYGPSFRLTQDVAEQTASLTVLFIRFVKKWFL